MATTAASRREESTAPMTREEKKVIFASSPRHRVRVVRLLSVRLARRDHRQAVLLRRSNPTAAFIFALLAFAAGFAVRPFGALVFGRLGDMIGRKYTFLVTILIMGLSTFIVGLLPELRVDRHRRAGHPDRAAPAAGPGARRRVRRRGDLRRRARAARQARRSTPSWIQTTATLGLFLSLLVILGVRDAAWATRRSTTGAGAFRSWSRSCCSASRSGSGCQLNESPAVPEDEGRGQDLEGAADRVVRPVEEPEDRAAGAARPDRRPGRGLVHGPVLRAVLPDADAEGRRARRPTC